MSATAAHIFMVVLIAGFAAYRVREPTLAVAPSGTTIRPSRGGHYSVDGGVAGPGRSRDALDGPARRASRAQALHRRGGARAERAGRAAAPRGRRWSPRR